MNRTLRLSSHRPHRGGAILVCILVALLIVMGIAASMLKAALRARLVVRQERQISQTEFLLESGIQRAVSKLKADPEFSEEAWRLGEDTIPGYGSALVEIRVTDGNEGGDKDVQIVAKLPADSPLSIQRTYRFTYPETVPSNEE